MAPPPEIRRTTSMPCRAAPSGSTSLRSDWKLPMITAGEAHSHTRSVGGRRPAATSCGEHLVEGHVQGGRTAGASWTSCQS